jgi:hypothetical protein
METPGNTCRKAVCESQGMAECWDVEDDARRGIRSKVPVMIRKDFAERRSIKDLVV